MHRSKSGSLSHVRSGSFASDRKACDSRYVRFAPKADKRVDGSVRQLCANSDITHRSKQRPYSIISSVWASNIGEIVRPSAFAVFKLIAT